MNNSPNNPDWRLGVTNTDPATVFDGYQFHHLEKGDLQTVANIDLSPLRRLTLAIPNASAILLNASRISHDAAVGIWKENGLDDRTKSYPAFGSNDEAFRYIELKIQSVILAFTAIEAFANESIPEDHVFERHNRSTTILEASFKETTERYASLEEKLEVILPDVFKCKPPKGLKCWAGYKSLKTIRDRLVHMKTEDRRYVYGQKDSLWGKVVLIAEPHILALRVIDHYLAKAPHKPWWYLNKPF